MNSKKFVDVHTHESERKGFAGKFESFLRTYRGLAQCLVFLPLILIYGFCIGLSLTPGFFIIKFLLARVDQWSGGMQILMVSLGLGLSYIVYAHILILVVPILNLPIKPFVKPMRGAAFSIGSIAWVYHNALTYLVRYTVLEFMSLTPMGTLFFRMMGMKIGKGVMLNTANVSDPCLITIEDHVFIGGSVHLMAHYGMKGYLVVEPVLIKEGATIGLKASIMGDVIIGKKATIKPHQVVMPKSRIADETVF